MVDFFEGLTGSAADYMGGGYQPFGGAQAYTPEYSGTAADYVTSAPIQGYTPTFNFDFSSFLPSTSFAPSYTSADYLGSAGGTPALSQFGAGLGFNIPSAFTPAPVVTPSITTGAVRGAPSAIEAPGEDRKLAGAPSPEAGGFLGIKGLSTADLLKGALGIGGSLIGMMNQRKAAEEAAAARREYEAASQKAAGELRGLSQPYLTQGGTALSMAAQGALSPAQQQQYQAAQAQLAQAAARSGGVGAIQSQQALQNIYQQALQNQQNMALQLLGPGNELAYRAVMEDMRGTQGGLSLELQLSQAANQASANMYRSIASALGFGGGAQQQQQAVA